MLSFDEAQTRVLSLAAPLEGETVAAAEAAGRVLRVDVHAKTAIPAFDASTMDGYAVRASDVGDAPLPVAGESRAGGAAPALAPRTACRIFTGAPLPAGADAVIMQEDATREGDVVRFRSKPAAGAFVRHAGDDLRAGEVAIPQGTRLGAREASMLASLDLATVLVSRQPRVVIAPTGDELRAPGSVGAPSSIPESNAVALSAMSRFAGATADVRAPLGDRASEVRSAFNAALASCDVLVTVGGVSVGEHDVVREALGACGVDLDFWRVAIKPGKPLAVGRRGRAIVIALPGNPVSALVTYALFGLPLLRAMQGDVQPLPRRTRVTLGASMQRSASDRLELARARLDDSGAASLLPNQASAALIGLCRADVLVCIPPGTARLDAGATVEAYSVGELGL